VLVVQQTVLTLGGMDLILFFQALHLPAAAAVVHSMASQDQVVVLVAVAVLGKTFQAAQED
jgi:hypothetical protein